MEATSYGIKKNNDFFPFFFKKKANFLLMLLSPGKTSEFQKDLFLK